MEVITTLVSTVGFPIAMCLSMAWYVKYTTDKHREELKEVNKSRQEELDNITKALNNNTKVIYQLYTKLGGDNNEQKDK